MDEAIYMQLLLTYNESPSDLMPHASGIDATGFTYMAVKQMFI